MLTETLLLLDNIAAGYDNQTVLKGISFDIPEGSVVMVIGPNGHGKTTLLRCVSGLVNLSSGSIHFAGSRIDGKRADRIVAAGVIHVPQGDLPFPDMSISDNLMMGAYLSRNRADTHRKLEEVYQLLPRLAERRDQTANTLSGGERRMLAIGRGLMAGGRILLVDEPSLGLAPIMIEQIYGILTDLKDNGRTILLVEESAARATEIADQVHLLDDGCMIWSGKPTELLGRPEILETYLGG